MKAKNFILLTFIFLSFFWLEIKAQTIWECATEGPPTDLLKSLGITTYDPELETVTIRFYIHIIRRSDGTGGLTSTQVTNAINIMKADYEERNIYFYKKGESSINNNTYFNFDGSPSSFNSLIQQNPHNDAINLYLLPLGISYGKASGIPGIALVIGGNYSQTSVISHEMGHCLGLWHTHSGRGCADFANCAEATNGTNCTTCGDLVCDTPADPCLSGNVNSLCQYVGPFGFNPDVPNIMSYTPPECMEHLTTGQFDRMFVMIENSSILQNVIFSGIPVTVDQKLSNQTTSGTVAHWESNNFVSYSEYLAYSIYN
ncbi:MAG: M43 family zinc metalloprotease [Ignavibacteria bacterium]|nr:M43 family zinc metalloprotease [Ignavibacteria bacterium]